MDSNGSESSRTLRSRTVRSRTPRSRTPRSRTVRSRTPRSSSASTTSISMATPATSVSGATALPAGGLEQPIPQLPPVPSGPLEVTHLSTTAWRTAYPRIGQFTATASDEIIAAVPSGLLHFKRVNDHDSKPWSEGRLLPNTAMLNDSSVSGLASIVTHPSEKESRLYVHCVAGGALHSFYLPTKDGSSWVEESYSPFSKHLITGAPAVASNGEYNSRWWSLVVPCQSGGLLHAYMDGVPSSDSYYYWGRHLPPVDHVAQDLGIISSVSIAVIETQSGYGNYDPTKKTNIVMVCVASGRLHTAQGERLWSSGPANWKAQAPTRIPHPGEVTGNPTLIRKHIDDRHYQLDLLVPSAEGGIFHFVRTMSTPDEWHMIARIAFPEAVPAASCLASHDGYRYTSSYYTYSYSSVNQFRALIQSGGRLYYTTTRRSDSIPWSRSSLRPIVSPGRFSG
ncbi:hypothetical protein F4777DRAFT_549667 [Nemania sp. FL0916]|nr:hypothetical protein F4777DRAFT_549667 [Nemania sp. FL0916]